jgi:PAS domain S-box-containing protein
MSELRILIVDDNQYDRALALREIKKFFPQLNYQEVIDEADFQEALVKNNFDLVVTDYQLLWTTGLDILYRLKKQRPDCPVIMFTGTGSEEIAVEAMKAGLDDYVIKTPKHYVRLAAAVRSAWQRSQQKQALEEFKQTYYRFFERVPLGLYRLNSRGEVLEANSTLTEMLGCSQMKDLQGETLIDFYIDSQLYLQWQEQLAQTEAVEEFEGQVRRLDGKLIWITQNAIAVKNSQGKIIGYEGALTDITGRKQAEFERIELLDREREARKEAETLNRIKDEFLATLSHELRTPLNAIIGWMQLLRLGKMDRAQMDRALDVIERNALAQNRLIEDLLDTSRIIRGTIELELKPVNVIEAIKASLDTISPGAKAKNLNLITQFDVVIAMVNGDEKRLQQVFWNLLINALKFTPDNGTVAVSSRTSDRHVIIEVKDTGQGISAEVLPYVFDRFRQAETKSSTRTKGGLGLGLAIVRHIIELHGGEVLVNSQGLGRGSTFTIILPLIPKVEKTPN